MKKTAIILTLTLLLCSQSKTVSAQAFEEGGKIISVGYGFPNWLGSIFNAYEAYGDYNATSLGPIYAKFEYGANDHIGFGLNLGYSSTNVDYVDVYNYSIHYSSLSILARVNWHFGDSDKLDPYYGFGIGYRSSNWKYENNDPYFDDTYYDWNIFPLGFETTVGARYFFTDNIAAYAELGFAKSIFQIGLSMKL